MRTHDTTESLADAVGVRAQSIRAAFCRHGHYFGFVPVKLPNGRLAWPIEARERLLRGEVGDAAKAPAEPLAA